MNDSAGHFFIRLLDDVGDLFWQSVVFQTSPEGLLVNAVESLFTVNKVDIQRRIILKGLFQNDAQSDPGTIYPFESLLVGPGDSVLQRLSFGSAGCDSTPFLVWATV
ncbi:hypothetical protein DPMN_161220 [Dreissena polymorpha]|uniref:Uncharacterized protein n=1 Tax=Dreissena polymorpha TaxID=45954 RepID=A0A9D4ESM1_DREPO|nr:hypothetical protein DPMN_161220 [Dreissena polymorpha]